MLGKTVLWAGKPLRKGREWRVTVACPGRGKQEDSGCRSCSRPLKGRGTGEREPPSGPFWHCLLSCWVPTFLSWGCSEHTCVEGVLHPSAPAQHPRRRVSPGGAPARAHRLFGACFTRCTPLNHLGNCLGGREGHPLFVGPESYVRKSSADFTVETVSHSLISFWHSCCPRASGKSPGGLTWLGRSKAFQPA